MAHPKLATVVGRSFLTATAAALMVGPLAAAGAAQTIDGVTDTLKLTCDEALETEEQELIDEFCTEAELDTLTSPLDKSVDEVTTTVDKTVTDASPTTAPVDESPDEEPGGGTVIPEDEAGGSPAPGGNGGTPVQGTGDGGFDGVDEGGNQAGSGDTRTRNGNQTRAGASNTESGGYGYNADGPFRPGMQSHSSLTLQPFAAPLVSVPPIYELPQIAQQLFGSDSAATAEDPMVAGAAATQASPYSPAGYSATSADPTGWLAATATGLIMLVGAGHAINGGRTPKQHRA